MLGLLPLQDQQLSELLHVSAAAFRCCSSMSAQSSAVAGSFSKGVLHALLCRWTPEIKKQIKQSRLDITGRLAVSSSLRLACIETCAVYSMADCLHNLLHVPA
jgi:hypothetical protein